MVVTAIVARQKGYRLLLWIPLALLFSVLALCVIALLPPKGDFTGAPAAPRAPGGKRGRKKTNRFEIGQTMATRLFLSKGSELISGLSPMIAAQWADDITEDISPRSEPAKDCRYYQNGIEPRGDLFAVAVCFMDKKYQHLVIGFFRPALPISGGG